MAEEQDPVLSQNALSVPGRVLAAQHPGSRGFITDDALRNRLNFQDIGFATAGNVFGGGDPNVAAAWRQAGQGITGVLQQRWFQKEFEIFEQHAINPAVQKLHGTGDSLVNIFSQIDSGKLVDPATGVEREIDPDSQEAMTLKQRALYTHTHEISKTVDEVMAAAGKYGAGNPLITGRIHDVLSSTSQTIASLTGTQVAGQQQAMAGVAETQAGTRLKHAQAGLAEITDPNLRSGDEDWQKSSRDPIAFLRTQGPEATASFIASGTAPFAQPLYDQMYARIMSEIEEDAMVNPSLGARVGVAFDDKGKPVKGASPDPELVKQVAMEQKQRAAEMAAVEAANSYFEGDQGYRSEVLRRESLTRWLPRDAERPTAKPTITGVMSKARIRDHAKGTWQNTVLPALEEVISSGEVNSREEIETWLHDYVNEIVSRDAAADPRSQSTARQVGNELMDYASRHWADSDLAREVTGERTWFEKGVSGPLGEGKRATQKYFNVD